MTTCCVTRRWTTKLLNLPQRPLTRRREQAEDPQLTDEQNRIVIRFILDRTFLPVLRGEVSFRDVFIPAGGWAVYDA
jgi:hypothetical protein